MGLAVTAYSGIAFALLGEGVDQDGDVLDDQDYFGLYVNPHYPAQAADLPLAPGEDQRFCVCSAYRERMGIRAGSYSGYGYWREQLAELAGYPAMAYEGEDPSHTSGASMLPYGPFHELIDFSDCEGSIGPLASAKLAQDFADFQPLADAHADERFRDLYAQWRAAFEMAAQGGAVSFH